MSVGRATSECRGRLVLAVVSLATFLLAAAADAGAGRRGAGPDGGFDPLGFPGDDSVVTAGVGVRAPAAPSAPRTDTIAVLPDSVPTAAWQVQFYATTDLAEATDLRERAGAELTDTVTVDFETPYYKLRVGFFTDRDDAEALAVKLRAMGYESAWVVQRRGVGQDRQ